jgi:hypothetical protein
VVVQKSLCAGGLVGRDLAHRQRAAPTDGATTRRLRSTRTNRARRFSHLEPMVAVTLRELEQAGVSEKPRVALADAGFWNERHTD